MLPFEFAVSIYYLDAHVMYQGPDKNKYFDKLNRYAFVATS